MNKKGGLFSGFVLSILLLITGCSYPLERRQGLDQLQQHIHQVQEAVNHYYKNNKVLPYRYNNEEYKLTTKYLVDFRVLADQLSEIPRSSFENGGNFLYVLTEVDRKPTVKLFDLRVQDKIQPVQLAVHKYLRKEKCLPIKETIFPHLYAIDFSKLHIPNETLPSPFYPGEKRELLIDDLGRVYIDYRCDVMRIHQENKLKMVQGDDLRVVLSQNSFYVPAYSPIIKYTQGDLMLIPM